ncbi:hypothetical protein ABB37_00471 [Leptomonas pyrrhocoris]|uniref:Transmembrane protein n=1 Tax=Leptomonas pyrrhocoris TaxID=157538 RepID=A0A0N0VI04_LEPPY|nr:hypothetical protein ABB37_00471 [Leptomonas pyrrhocoris]KPA86238.1 hypothetical protein ABB37_00471 [Leptomonas pyrrhocoris]|eukprot:XP_015664677.1 hypothetical protein ABB37_00471 [Leptomonas pyrrhocoris]
MRSSGCLTCSGTCCYAATLAAYRPSSSQVPRSVHPPTAASTADVNAPSTAKMKAAPSSTPQLDAKAAEQVRLAHDIGEQAFGENTKILTQIAYRGLRAFVVCAIGMGAFMWAMKRKKAELAAEETATGSAEKDEDPTQRYLEEMRSMGFDVDTLEEELEQTRVAKMAAAQAATKAA